MKHSFAWHLRYVSAVSNKEKSRMYDQVSPEWEMACRLKTEDEVLPMAYSQQ